MEVAKLVTSNDLWRDILKRIGQLENDNTPFVDRYGVMTPENVRQMSPDLVSGDRDNGYNITIDELKLGESWNVSVRKLQALINRIYGTDTDDLNKYRGRKGDAGASYTGGEWVKPFTNIDNDTYSDVRSVDAINSVLKSDDNSQFTIGQIAAYVCRLIMPEYIRRVEVEDLNRNFWVIAQVLGTICAFLFDPDSELYKILNRLLDEITQLWENVAFLWSIIPLIRGEDKVVQIFCQVPLSPENGYMLGYKNYDNFSKDSEWSSGIGMLKYILRENHLEHYFHAFPNSHVILIPLVRGGNYQKNYYYRLYLPGIIFHNFRNDSNSMISFFWNDDTKQNETQKEYLRQAGFSQDEIDFITTGVGEGNKSYKYLSSLRLDLAGLSTQEAIEFFKTNSQYQHLLNKTLNLVYIDMKEKKIMKRTTPVKYILDYERYIAGTLTTQEKPELIYTEEVVKDLDILPINNLPFQNPVVVNGIKYNTLFVQSIVPFSTEDDILSEWSVPDNDFRLKDSIFVIRQNESAKCLYAGGRYLETYIHRISPDYEMGSIKLSFQDFLLTNYERKNPLDNTVVTNEFTSSIPYLGDVISYYADGGD